MFKRTVSFLLSWVLVLGMLLFSPTHVHAEDGEDTANSVPVGAETVTEYKFEQENTLQCDVSFVDTPSSDELFAVYAQNLFYNIPANYGTAGGARLSGNDKLLYDELVPVIQQIANGDRSSTTISFGQSVNTAKGQWIPDVEMTFSGTDLDLYNVFYALMEDFPYEMYWFDKSVSMEVTCYYTSGREHYKHIRLSLPVSNNYRWNGDLYTIDTAKTSAAKKAAANAKSIVAKYADKSDYEKLLAYKEEICDLVEYDHYAADNNTFSINMDPWQLIYCFDEDPTTNLVCEGYAKAYMYLCDISLFSGNVTCHTVSGIMLSSGAGGGHMWNIVSVNGRNYLVDVTNSEPKTVGRNGDLFLMGTPSGDLSSGYLFEYYRDNRDYSISYTYDDDVKTYWGTDSGSILHLDSSSCKNHDFTDWNQAENSPHRKESRLCSLCGFTDFRNLDHVRHSYTEKIVAPTCAKMGYTVHTCQCGDSYKDFYVNALGHTGGSATCTDKAVCTRCEKAYGELDQSNHSGGTQVKKSLEATCIAAGYTGDTHCSGCGVLLRSGDTIPAKGHSFTPWVETKAPTCVCTGVEQRDCENCDYNELRGIEATGHRYTAEVIAPTCTQKGYTLHSCACGSGYQDTYVDALGHTGGIATCESPAICTRCNLPYGEWDPSKHVGDTEVINQKAVSCTRSGYTGDTVCKTCGETILYGDIIKATGHDYAIQVIAPTYTEKGYTLYTCSVCGHQVKTDETATLTLPKISIKAVTSSKTGKPVVSWAKLEGEVTYKVYRATSSKGKYSLKGEVTDNSFEDTSASVGKKYYYKVKATADGKTTDYSSYKSATCKLATPVIKTSVSSSTGKVKVSWGKVSSAKKYEVYRATSTGSFKKLTTTTSTSYTDSSASVGTTYRYKVKAVASKSTYNSAYSETLTAKRICAQPDLEATISTTYGKPSLSWDKVSGAKEYKVYRAESQNGEYTLVKTTTSTSYTDKIAEFDKDYWYQVDVVGSKTGTDNDTDAAVKVHTTCAKPSVSITISSKKPKVSWKPVEGATKYYVYRATSKSGTYTKVATVTDATSYRDSKAKKGKTYYYKVKAIASNSAANSAYSSVKSIKSK